jgi:release factor glutamine methyltransferase
MMTAPSPQQPPARNLGRRLPRSRRIPAPVRSLWRFALRWQVRLFQQHRYNRLSLEWIDGRPLLVLPQVFNPRLLRTGEILVRLLDDRLIPRGAIVLDMGTGSGVGALFAARWAAHVVAVDINPEAVRCARINVLIHRLESWVEVLHGDLFEPVRGRRFDVILFNPPYYHGEPRDDLDRAWRSTGVLDRFAAGLRDHLMPGGHALVVLSTDGEQSAFLNSFHTNSFEVDTVGESDLINEVVTVYRLRDAQGGSNADPA